MALNFPSDTSSPYIDPTSGLKYIYNASVGAWEAAIQPPVIVSASQPDITIEGFVWWDTANSILYVYENGQWIAAATSGSFTAAKVTIGTNPPGSPNNGDFWWDDVGGRLFIYYVDVDSSQWIEASPNLAGDNGGGVVPSDSAPPDAVEGDLWFNTINDQIYIYVDGVWTAAQSTAVGVNSVAANAPVTITGTSADPVINVSSASTSNAGVIRIATQAEVNAASLSNVVITPGTLSSGIDNYLPDASTTVSGVVELATSGEITTGTDATKAMTPAAFSAALPNLGVGNPPGTIIAFAGQVVPSGYLECDGSVVSRTTYANLFAAISDLYGVGDGSTTFGLPDLRGEFLRGWDNSRGIDSGRAFGSTQNSAILQHTHSVTDPGHTHTYSKSFSNTSATAGSTGFFEVNSDTATGSSTTGITIDNAGGSESRPRNTAILYCIKT